MSPANVYRADETTVEILSRVMSFTIHVLCVWLVYTVRYCEDLFETWRLATPVSLSARINKKGKDETKRIEEEERHGGSNQEWIDVAGETVARQQQQRR